MIFLVTAWVPAIATFLVCVHADVLQERREHLVQAPPGNPVEPLTLSAVVVTFVVILATGGQEGFGSMLGSAVIGALAAPMVFELPFDLIVTARVYPPLPPQPATYRALFFLPLFLIEILTLSLLSVSSRVAVSRVTFDLVAAMFVVFAGWALAGFGYPSAPIPIALNVVFKLLAFAATLSLFLPGPATDDRSGAGPGQGRDCPERHAV